MDLINGPRFHERLIQQTARRYLNIAGKTEPLSRAEVSHLLLLASAMSLSDEVDEIAGSYDICSRIVEIYGDEVDEVSAVADMIFSRLGNFPGRSLLRAKYDCPVPSEVPYPLALERLAREAENSVEDNSLLTDFQYRLYSALADEQALSVSAPTSAGKSFVLNLDLARRLEQQQTPFIIYVVPTRALVTEVLHRVRETIRERGIEGISVRSAPFPIENSQTYRGAVYVLTQERLLRLISWADDEFPPTTLIVDEAHELQKGKRGILLQNAVEMMVRKFPRLPVLFACPLIKNPGYILNVFGLNTSGRYFVEEVSPVAQNIMLINPVPGKPKRCQVEQIANNATIDIGIADLTFNFRGAIADQKANFAYGICREDESIIVFSDDPDDAESTAVALADCVKDYEQTPELLSFVKFIASEIHPEHPLVSTLKKGIGFHYGHMPSIVRGEIERFFKQGKLRYLCSTSTLLQGVNLPAKHIVILNPRLGGDGMSRADFRNLAGRAGRLLKEFHGHVWCLRPGEWEIDSFQGNNLQTIQSAMDTVMQSGGNLIGAVLDGVSVGDESELADAALSRLFHQVREVGPERTFNAYVNETNEERLRENIALLEALPVDIPVAILELHRSLRPDQLQEVYQLIISHENLENLILINPHEAGGKARMELALSIINRAFSLDMPDKYFNWVSGTAYRWIWGIPIGELLKERVAFVRRSRPDASASPEIRKLLKLIETEVRYRLVKYFAAFEDLCRLAFSNKMLAEPSIAPYHIYLEFGASEPAPLSLMALGLSRFTALKLAKLMPWTNDRSPEEYLKAVVSHPSVRYLPGPCRQEIRDLIGNLPN